MATPDQRLIAAHRLTRSTPPEPGATYPAERAKGQPQVEVDLRGIWSRLRRDVEGEVRFDAGSRGLYAQDASNYLQVPLGVVLPRSREDVVATVAACRELGLPVVSRGGGTSLAGQAINSAVVIDFSKYQTRILELDATHRRARVEPGVICDDLVHAAQPSGLTWGPKPSTHTHCCFGGMLANNCGGMQAQYAGTAVNNVEAMEVVLYDGTRLQLGWMDEPRMRQRIQRGGREGALYQGLAALRDKYAALIRQRFPRIPRRISGYNLDQLLPDAHGRFNVARALVGSEGTCATMLEATVNLVEYFPESVIVVAGYQDIFHAGDHVPLVNEFHPLGVEAMDQRLYDLVSHKELPQGKYLDLLPEGKGWLLVQIGSQDREEARSRARALIEKMCRGPRRPIAVRLIEARDEQEHLWKVRESGLGATAFVPGERDSWPGFEDSAVHPDQLGSYLRDLHTLFQKYDYDPSLYGHFGMGCVHCRVQFDLGSAAGIAKYRSFMLEATDLVIGKYHGSLSGEHGDGQARGELLEKMFGAELMQAFREFKSIWDPHGKMNPGKLVDARPFDSDLKLGPAYDPWAPPTHFKFPEDGGSFARATLRCVGVGRCRRLSGTGDQDVMCPSFMVTREEKHSTRGRAHLLWEMLRGDGTPITKDFRDENVKEALDLCLSCKGCKGDCPVNVDIATHKAEFLAHYYQGRLRPRHAYAFGLVDKWARLGSLAPGLVNLLARAPGTRSLAKLMAGMGQKRAIPAFAPETFRTWFSRRPQPRAAEGSRVLLWADTFNNYFHPETARAAVQVLEHLGFQVSIPERVLCCGRPLYDYGMLDLAVRYLDRILRVLEPEIRAGTPIVVLEPSCCAVFRDELPALMPNHELARGLAQQTLLLSEFLMTHAADRLPKLRGKAIVQGHCHHKAIMRFDAQREVFRGMELDADVLESGCCGMAGSFGFEADKYAVSQACGERVLLPRVRGAAPDTLVIADGFSCRTQIAQGSNRHALHLAEALKLALDAGPTGGVFRASHEAGIADRREHAIRRSVRYAALAVVGLTVAAVGARALARSHRWQL